jgi:proline dehydrogenase
LGIREDLVFKVARRWISGREMQTGIDGAKQANGRGLGVILNFLGEDITELDEAERQVEEYLRLQQAIHDNKIDGAISIKLTQFGLIIDEPFALERVERVALNAEALGQVLWLDMEGSRFTEKTLEVYSRLLSERRDVGLAVQAYMRRSGADLETLLTKRAKVRLVKGAYKEGKDVVFATGGEVRDNYSKLMRMLFEGGENFTIATHDSRLIEEARTLSQKHHPRFEFAMLKGIRDDLKAELVAEG